MRSISPHGRDRARPFAVEIGQRRFALALFLCAGRIATHRAAMPSSQARDMKSAHALSAGGFHFLPGKVHRYAFAKVPTIVQVSSNGPFDITFVDPDDDPQKANK